MFVRVARRLQVDRPPVPAQAAGNPRHRLRCQRFGPLSDALLGQRPVNRRRSWQHTREYLPATRRTSPDVLLPVTAAWSIAALPRLHRGGTSGSAVVARGLWLRPASEVWGPRAGQPRHDVET